MKKTSTKVLAMVMAVVMITGAFAACSGKPKKGPAKFKIGVIQLMEHVALDAAYDGFKKGMEEAGYKEGEQVEYVFHNAQGEAANCATIADQLATSNCDLILAIATTAAQTVANRIKDIPILVTSVTDPEKSSLVASNALPGGNVSGTSDLNPIKKQMNVITELVPSAKRVGLFYCSSEANSKLQVDLAKADLAQRGIATTEFTITQQTDIQSVVESMAGKVDAVYIPTDNMLASGMATVSQAANKIGIPVFPGECGMVSNGGLATCGLNYFNLGQQTATMAVDILVNGKDIATMPIQYLDEAFAEYAVNTETAAALGITVPDEFLSKAIKYPAVG